MGASRAWITRLAPRGEVDIAAASSSAAAVRNAVTHLGEQPVRWAMELASDVAGRILDEVPVLGGSPAAFEMLRRGNQATTLNALVALAVSGDDVEGLITLAAREPTLAGVREFVRRAIPLEHVLHGVRIGHAATTAAFHSACVELCPASALGRELPAITRELFRYVDELSGAMIDEYLAEHEVWTTSAAAVRADVVRSILAGVDRVEPESASRRLGYDLSRRHQAAVLWSDTPDEHRALRSAATDLLAARGAAATLVVPVGADRVWAWGGGSTDRPALPRPGDTIAAGLSAALGAPAVGLAGFRRSHVEAERAAAHERLRRAGGRASRAVTDYPDVVTVALLSTDLPAARAFVQRELGPLAELDDAMETLRTTLRLYFETERGLAAVAGRLHIARGTVTYRVRRAEQLLGRPVGDRRFPLTAALELASDLGDAVLRNPEDGD